MSIKLRKIKVEDAQVGMYVSGLDRPWTQTPYPLQGFHIKTVADIEELRRHCKWVQIDTQLSKTPLDKLQTIAPIGSKDSTNVPTRNRIRISPLKLNKSLYQQRLPLNKEAAEALETYQLIRPEIASVMNAVARGETPNLKAAVELSHSLVESTIRNPDALGWLARVQTHDKQTFDHSIRACIWAISLGRHLGLEKAELYTLAEATLLKDLGTLKITRSILTAKRRTEQQEAIFRTHVIHCVKILEDASSINAPTIEAIKNHCERINGTGYPRGLLGDKISLLSKIIGIVSTYDTITNPRYGEPATPSKAISALYVERNRAFQEELVVEFIQSMGIYPTGTVVELNSGEVGVVVEQSPKRRLRPIVMLVTDAAKNMLKKPKALDLFRTSQNDSGLSIEIARDLEPTTYDIDREAARTQYLNPSKLGMGGLFNRLLNFGS